MRPTRGWWGSYEDIGMRVLPRDVVRYNGGIRCDMAVGPCACGAWHEESEPMSSIEPEGKE